MQLHKKNARCQIHFHKIIRLVVFLLYVRQLPVFSDVGIDKVGNTLSVHDFRHSIHLPFWTGRDVILYETIYTRELAFID